MKGTKYDIELQNCLDGKISNGTIKIHSNVSEFIADIEATYPMSFSGIKWADQPNTRLLSMQGSTLPTSAVKTFLEQIVWDFPEMANENVVVIGDGLTEFGYEMSYANFIRSSECFFEIPQYTYIWFYQSKKCINLTFWNELYFG